MTPTQKSPGGSNFPYYYKGGEIHCFKYGSFYSDEEGLFALMKAEEEFVARPNRQLPIWVDFYETKLTDRVLVEFLKSMERLRPHILKLAVVGFSWFDRWRIRRLGKKLGIGFRVPAKYFSDPEIAKTWLVREG